MPAEVAAVIAGGVITLLTFALTIWGSKKFGIGSMAREADTQQEALIKALRENNVRLAADNRRLRRQNRQLVNDNRDLRTKLATAYGDIANLYRGQGVSVPNHVLETIIELKENPESGDAEELEEMPGSATARAGS